jgi:hypothetical protein
MKTLPGRHSHSSSYVTFEASQPPEKHAGKEKSVARKSDKLVGSYLLI